MDIKTKIIKILPYWLIALILVCSAQVFFNSFIFSSNIQPMVLGVSTEKPSVGRGENEIEPSLIKQLSEPDYKNISAKSFLVFNLSTGQELMEKNSSQKFYIASLTKLMTGLVAYNNTNLNSILSPTSKDYLNVKPSLGLLPKDELEALDVFNAMLIGSNNDAALAISHFVENITGKNFIDLMNEQAVSLGMQNTSFSNAIGFDSQNNYSTAQDLKILISATQKLSVFTDLGRRQSYEFSGSLKKTYYSKATNQLIKNHPDIQAIKTGYTNGAGGAMATKVKLGQEDIVILVLDSTDRETDTLELKDLLEKNFSF